MNVLELRKQCPELSDKAFWDGVKWAVKKGWVKRDGMEITILLENPPLGEDEKLILILAGA